MIDKRKFYGKDHEIPVRTRMRIWNNIKKEIIPSRNKLFGGIELKSFSFGLAAAVILFFTSIGIKSTIGEYIENKMPVEQKINAFYQDAINSFEKSLPSFAAFSSESGEREDMLAIKKEQLGTVDEAIKIFHDEGNRLDMSRIKQIRLMELYKMKLQLLNEILALEGSSL